MNLCTFPGCDRDKGAYKTPLEKQMMELREELDNVGRVMSV